MHSRYTDNAIVLCYAKRVSLVLSVIITIIIINKEGGRKLLEVMDMLMG